MHVVIFQVFFGSEIRLVTGTGFKPDEGQFELSLVGSIPTRFRQKLKTKIPPAFYDWGISFFAWDSTLLQRTSFREYELVAAFFAVFY